MNRPLLPDVYLPRDTDAFIEDWVSSDRRFLLVQGPRQVGKSASVGHALLSLVFGVDYGYIDFSNNEVAEALYASSSVTDTLIQDLLFSVGASSLKEGAILFLDEIQNALPKNIEDVDAQRRWIESLLSSAESASIRLVLTGSFLGLSLSGLSGYFAENGYPSLTIRPMSFHEFALAKGFLSASEWNDVRSLCCAKKQLPMSMHRKVMDAFACYLYVGGMPVSVSSFDEKTGDMSKCEKELRDLIEAHKSVLAQYMDIQGRESFFDDMMDLFYQGIKASDKKAFNQKAYSPRKIDVQFLDFIRRSEVGLLVFPPDTEECLRAKIYFSDVGIMHYLAFHGRHPEHEAKDAQTGLTTLRRYYAGESTVKIGNIGYVFEQVVASALAQQGIEAQYLSEEGYEVEFLYRGTGLEIKSGDYDSRASLKWYVGKKRVGFVLGPHPYVGKLGELNYAPIYWVFFLAEGPRLFDGDLAPVPSEQETGLRSLLVEYDGVLS